MAALRVKLPELVVEKVQKAGRGRLANRDAAVFSMFVGMRRWLAQADSQGQGGGSAACLRCETIWRLLASALPHARQVWPTRSRRRRLTSGAIALLAPCRMTGGQHMQTATLCGPLVALSLPVYMPLHLQDEQKQEVEADKFQLRIAWQYRRYIKSRQRLAESAAEAAKLSSR